MIDIHSHIIPGVDDGAKDMDTAMSMLRAAEKDGTETIIATPHFWYGYYENNYQDIVQNVQKLSSIAKECGINISILPGAEIFLDRHTLELYKAGTIRGLNNTKYLLLELPMDRLPKDAFESIYELKLLGAEIIIAHPERYVYIIEKPSTINDFLDEGYYFQINTGSISGIFGKEIKKTAEILLKHHIPSFIASDAHTNGHRCPGLSSAYKSIGKDYENEIRKNSHNLINNENIEKNYEKIKDKKFFSLFSK